MPCGEEFDEDDLYEAMDALTGHWCALEKGLAAGAFTEPVSLVLYDLTSVYFEGAGPDHFARYGHSRDHRGDRPQIILAVATDTAGTPLHLSVLRGNRADTSTLQSFLKILQRRFAIAEAVFVFDGGMSSSNLKVLEAEGISFVTGSPTPLLKRCSKNCRRISSSNSATPLAFWKLSTKASAT